MDVPTKLTPFSQSLLHPALNNALNRLARDLAPASPPPPLNLQHPQGPNAFLAELVLAAWGGSPPDIGRLLGVEPPTGSRRGKPGSGAKQAQAALQEFNSAYTRLRRWSEWVFASEWSQAQLLQVMEEVEPKVEEALHWVHALAVAAIGGYERLGALLAKKEKDAAKAESLRLGLVAGLETPDSRFLHGLALGKPVAELRETFGHMPLAQEGEVARPRVVDAPADQLATPPVEVWNWDLGRAQKRRVEAEKRAMAQASVLGRSGLRKTLELTQQALVAHARAREALAFVLAAARHWALAAAEEGARDGRIHHPDEIFMLEIEEIKQMMTGEWHSRAHVDALIKERQSAYDALPARSAAHAHSLGVAGYDTEGALQPFVAPGELTLDAPPGFMALAENWQPGWWRVVLKAEGLIDLGGHLLTWMASIARSGDLPALIGGADYAAWPRGERIRLDPARNRAETTD
ncbi:MAG TPA: hypothetical protein EYP25_09600 [Anaerolineae bacterium]|nr:hypothetical protein [Caldilineae bacterium]HID34801.1 hypothetical protein [Anaerolineae bacterium]